MTNPLEDARTIATIIDVQPMDPPDPFTKRITVDTTIHAFRGMRLSPGAGWPAIVLDCLHDENIIIVRQEGRLFLGKPGDDLLLVPDRTP